jgi:hypothetical protein
MFMVDGPVILTLVTPTVGVAGAVGKVRLELSTSQAAAATAVTNSTNAQRMYRDLMVSFRESRGLFSPRS